LKKGGKAQYLQEKGGVKPELTPPLVLTAP